MNFHKGMPPPPKSRNRNRGAHTMELVITSHGITKKKSRELYKDICLILSRHAVGPIVGLHGKVPGVEDLPTRRRPKGKLPR